MTQSLGEVLRTLPPLKDGRDLSLGEQYVVQTLRWCRDHREWVGYGVGLLMGYLAGKG